ncbi:hypothetical protein Bpfe_010862 [Biomphalaria pfeifferi]|uniref:TNF family profile domain-containing protein n=1 Tax=Biomphalaria pfeifferi TaxID=112525 RepID=A0AAD8BTV8_BIOPF|nr:hypothetical protein Bpfe_010862 [Biomphalaria pfeifferi]
MSSCDETASQISDDTASQVSDDTASQVSDKAASEINVVSYEESPPLTLTTANIKIQSIFRQSSRDSILSQAASAVSVQHVITSYTSQKQRPLPLLPGESHTREIYLNIVASEIKRSQESDAPTAPHHYQGVQSPKNVLSERKAAKRKKVSGNSCLFPQKYYKVSDAFEQRKNMSWLLRKKTLVCFSSLSVALSFVSCGLLLVMKFWTHSTPTGLNVCAETNSRNQSRAMNTSRSSSNCYSEQLDQILSSRQVDENVVPIDNLPVYQSSGGSCFMKVSRTSWYFIYSSVTVNISQCAPEMKQWKHQIVYLPRNESLANRTLTFSIKNCCSGCPVYTESSFTGAIYRLEDGDQLQTLVDVKPITTQNPCISIVNIGEGNISNS